MLNIAKYGYVLQSDVLKSTIITSQYLTVTIVPIMIRISPATLPQVKVSLSRATPNMKTIAGARLMKGYA